MTPSVFLVASGVYLFVASESLMSGSGSGAPKPGPMGAKGPMGPKGPYWGDMGGIRGIICTILQNL